MTPWALAAVVLLGAGLLPLAVAAGRGDSPARLVALQLAGAITTAVLLLLAQVSGQSSYFIVALVLSVLSVTGTLVFTRLVQPGP